MTHPVIPAMRIGAIVQARMGSGRLPGKSLRSIAGQPMLQYVLDRLQRCPDVDRIVVATSTAPCDDALAGYCEDRGIACVRGSEHDVASRFMSALEREPLDAFVRVCGDRPLLDQALVSRAVGLYRAGDHDLVTNVWPATFPPGQTVEVVRTATFLAAIAGMNAADREHVTPLFYRDHHLFRIQNFVAAADYSGVRLVVDTEADAQVIEGIVARMQRDHWTYSLDEIVDLYRAHLVTPA